MLESQRSLRGGPGESASAGIHTINSQSCNLESLIKLMFLDWGRKLEEPRNPGPSPWSHSEQVNRTQLTQMCDTSVETGIIIVTRAPAVKQNIRELSL